MTSDRDTQWHLDKRVPIAIVTALIVQTLSVVAVVTDWKASTEARLAALERTAGAIADTDRRQWERMQTMAREQESLHARLAGLDERTKGIAKQTDRILGLILKQMETHP